MHPIRIPADVLHEVSLPRWLALLAAYGAPKALLRGKSLAEIAEAARSGKLGARAADAVARLRGLGDEAARAAIFEAAEDRGVDLSAWPEGDGPMDDAARLLAEHPEDDAGIVERALFRVARNATKRPYRLFLAARPLGAGEFSAANVKRFSELVARALEKRAIKPYVRAELTPDAGRPDVVVVEIVRAERTEAPFALVGEGKGAAPGRAPYTPLAADVIRLDAKRERLSIATSARWLVHVYRKAFGEAFLGGEDAIAGKASITLGRVLRHGADALKVPGFSATVREVRAVAVRWDSGEYDTMRRAGRNVLASMAFAAHHLQGGELDAVTLRFNFVGGDVVDVELRLPNRAHWKPSRHDATIADWLDAAGFVGQPPEPHDLFSLAPHDRPRAAWVLAFGEAAVRAMVGKKILVKSEARAVAHPEHPDGARDLVVFRTKAGDAWGIPDDADDEVGARTLDKKDLETYRLDAKAAAALLAHAAGATGTPHAIVGRPGLFDLGQRAVGPTSLRVFAAFAEPWPHGLADELRLRALPGHAVVLVPRGRKLGVGVAEVEMPSLAGDLGELPRVLVQAAGLTPFVDVWLAAPVGTRLAIDVKGREAVIDGVRLKLAELPFLLLSIVAEARGAVVPVKDLDKKLGGVNAAGITKDTKRRLVQAMKDAFAEANAAIPRDIADIVASESGGYRLTVASYVR